MQSKKKSISLKKWIDYTKKALEGEEGIPIWSIMTAMRGPDDENYTLKKETTARIRFAVFGRAPHDGGVLDGTPKYNCIGADVNGDGGYCHITENNDLYSHFGKHIRHAYDALVKDGVIPNE